MSECIEHKGYIDADGYGGVTFNGRRMKSNQKAWIVAYGEIPKGMHVLHKCDNRSCINVEHLYIGTHTNNMRDRSVRNRTNLTSIKDDDVREMRRMRSSGSQLKQISECFNLGISTVHSIITYRTRKYVE